MKIESPPETTDILEIKEWLNRLWLRINDEDISTSATWDPGSIADGDEEAKEITLTGAEMGDYVIASFSLDVTDLTLDANVTASDKVTVVLSNNTGGAVDLAEGTVYVRLLKRTS